MFVALSILGSSVQPNTVSVRVFCGPTMCRARGNEVSAMNILTPTSSTPTYEQRTAQIWDYDIVQLHMEQEIVQCHDIEAAEEI